MLGSILFLEELKSNTTWWSPNLDVFHRIQVHIIINLFIINTWSLFQNIASTDLNSTNKVVRSYALPGEEHCMVKLLDKYLSLLPPTAPHFYMKAKEKFPTDPTVRCFINQRVGINQLKKMLPELSEKAGIGIRYVY